MLIKCVCSSCGHSYLSDDEAGDVACPRCDAATDIGEPRRDPKGYPEPPIGVDGVWDGGGEDQAFEPTERRFVAKAPPAMYLTKERLARGIVFGSVATAIGGALLGAALAALSLDAPGVAALALGVTAGLTCRSGFGGRTARHSVVRAFVACTLVAVIGFAGFTSGSWLVERFAGSRVTRAQKELDEGLRGLSLQYGDAQDAGAAILIKQRIDETRRLRGLSGPELEDYLWTQQAQLKIPVLAHAKLRITTGPIVKLGPDRKPIHVRREATMGIRIGEMLIAILLAARFVKPR